MAVTYNSEVLADSPWGYWKTDETSGTTLADSSGNSRPMTTAASPTLAQTGPDGATADAISFTNTINQYAATSATSAAGVITMEAWVYLTANPTSVLGVMARSIGLYSSGASDGELTIDSSGRPGWMVFDGSGNRFIVGSTALSLNTWHHMVGSVGAAGMKLRVDKVTVTPTSGTNPLVTSTTAYTGASQQLFMRAGGSRCTSVSPIKIAREAYYTTQLSDARTDAHYDAMLGGGTAASGTGSLSLSGSGAVAASTSGAGALALSGSGTAKASVAGAGSLTLSGAGVIDFQPASGTGSLSLSGAGGAGVGVAGTGSLTLSGTGTAAGAQAASGTGSLALTGAGSATLAAAGTGSLTFGAIGTVLALYVTDLTNAMNGRRRGGRGTATVDRPAAALPSGRTYGVRYDKAIAYPVPTMVDGRPT